MQVARRQLAVKGDKSNSWFISIKDVLLKYDLPMSWLLLDTPPTKFRWKNQVKKKVNKYWSDILKSRASLYPSLQYLNNEAYKPVLRPPVIQEPNGVKDVPRIHTKIKMLTGSYRLQVNRASFNQNNKSPVCLLCKKEDETLEPYSMNPLRISESLFCMISRESVRGWMSQWPRTTHPICYSAYLTLQ